MRVLLVRHGETVDNVAQVYAGVRDSALTNHGVLQADRLGRHLASLKLNLTHVFSSDLQRAFKTAEAIRTAQPVAEYVGAPLCSATTQLQVLREQDFGFYEGKPFYARPPDSKKSGKEAHQDAHKLEDGFQDMESQDSMASRVNLFLEEHLMPVLTAQSAVEDAAVVIVSHGIILTVLWRCLLRRFAPGSFSVVPGLLPVGRSVDHIGGWSNTGYLDITLTEPLRDSSLIASDVTGSNGDSATPSDVPLAKPLTGWRIVVTTVNGRDHLQGLKRTRGGVGSSKHEENQQKIESFFKKTKIESGEHI